MFRNSLVAQFAAAILLVIKAGSGTEFGGGDITNNEYPAYKPSTFSVEDKIGVISTFSVEGKVGVISTVSVSEVTSFTAVSVGSCESGVF